MLASADAPIRLSATSRRKLVLRLAASSGVSGGTRRVLARPGIEAFAITAMAQLACAAGRGHRPRHCSPSSDPAEPVEAAILPVAAAVGVGDLHGGDPLGVLEAELHGRAQAQWKTEGIGDRFPGVLGREQRLRMQRRGHVDAAVVVVGAAEGDVLGGEVGADALQEQAQVHAGPLADVVPALDADVADDDLLLGQVVDLPQRPRPLVADEARQLQLPGVAVDRRQVLDVVVGVEARRLDDLVGRERGRQVVGPEQQRLGAVVPLRTPPSGRAGRSRDASHRSP